MADESGKKSKLNTTEEFPNEAEDRISALPDSLLLHILSFLSTKEVVQTCLLSQRWQFLWTDISEIYLVEESEDIAKVRSFVDWVGRMLVACNGKCLNKFAVDFCYDKRFASNVKLWVRFAVKNKVKNITLRFGQFPQYECKLPQMLYSHSSMTSLTVNFSVMAPRGAIKWGSLKSLSIGLVRLEACVMEKILSGCPVLEVLHLNECWGLSYLNISSPKLATLLIEDWELYDVGEDYFLEISAPYVLDLSIIDSKGGYEYKLRNVSSVVRAKLNFDYPYIEEITDPIPSAMDYMKELLESLQSVKELEMGPWCVEVLTLLEMKGQLPPSTRWCLTLDVWAHKRSIAGILGILISSPKLERLVIKGRPFPIKETEPYYLDAAYLQNANLDLVAFHVKTVKITSFKESFCSGEPMATIVQLLLKGATALEKMVISAEELDINKSARTLISFPRASSKAVIVFD